MVILTGILILDMVFHTRGAFSLPNGEFGKNFIIFFAHMRSPLHVDSNKNISIFSGKCQSLGLKDTILNAKAQYSINFIKTGQNRYA